MCKKLLNVLWKGDMELETRRPEVNTGLFVFIIPTYTFAFRNASAVVECCQIKKLKSRKTYL